MRQRTYQTQEGERRTVIECEVDEVGPSLRYATAQVGKVPPRPGSPGARREAGPTAADPFASDEGRDVFEGSGDPF